MASLTNIALATATIANLPLGSQSLTWDEATFTWDAAVGTWDNPYTFTNVSLNTATMTNVALS